MPTGVYVSGYRLHLISRRETQRERKRTEKGEERSRGQQGYSEWAELSKRSRKRNRESEGWRGRVERVNQWRRFETGRLWRQYRLEIRASAPYTNTLVLPGRTATHTLSHCQLTRHAQGLCWCFSSALMHCYKHFMLLGAPWLPLLKWLLLW